MRHMQPLLVAMFVIAIATAQTQPDRAQLLVQVAEIRATVNRLQEQLTALEKALGAPLAAKEAQSPAVQLPPAHGQAVQSPAAAVPKSQAPATGQQRVARTRRGTRCLRMAASAY
jgi:uncharacterized coiled-coil protein SlyX